MRYLTILFFILLLKAALLLIIIEAYQIDLAPDEAQYWTWSQELDWGYYSKPPGIAWQIWLTTSIFGNSVLGIRIGAVFIGFFLSFAVYYLAFVSGLRLQACFWAAVAMAFSPLGIYLSFAATTDGGAILMMTIALAVIVRGLQEEKGPNYLIAGVWIFLGALFKWTAFAVWPFALLFLLLYRNMRKWSFLLGLLISLAAFLPSLYWNWTHDWATFKHVASSISNKRGGNFFDFLGAQIVLLSPLFFALWIASYFYVFREKNRGLLFCAAVSMGLLIYFFGSMAKKIQPNWAVFLYPPAMVLIGWIGYEKSRKWLHAGAWFSVAATCCALAIPWFQSNSLFAVPYKVNPFRQSLGWSHLPSILKEVGYDPNSQFLFGDKYQVASLLSFYSPGKKRAYFFNVSDTRKNQCCYWPQMEQKEVGNSGYFVVLENMDGQRIDNYEQHYLACLEPFFQHVKPCGGYPLFAANGKPVKYAVIFQCSDYLGNSPIAKESW